MTARPSGRGDPSERRGPARGRATSPGKRARPAPARNGRWFLSLTALAWIHRVAFLLSNRDRSWPFTVFYEGDAETFYNYARAILSGSPYDAGVPFHPPAFPHFLAVIHAALGAEAPADRVPYLALKIVMALIGSIPVGLIFVLVRPYLGRAAALVTAALCLYSFGLYVTAVAPVSESLYLTLLLAALIVWTRKLEHPLTAPGDEPRDGWLPAAGLGLLLGLLALTRAEGVLVALLLWGIGLGGWVWRRRKARLRPWIVVAVLFLVTLAPWTIRNHQSLEAFNRRMGSALDEPLPTFVVISAYGPLNFALANNRLADGAFSREFLESQKEVPVLDLTDSQHLHLFLHGYEVGWSYIRNHPVDFLNLVLRKWGIFYEALKSGWTQWNWPAGLDGLRRPVDIFVPHSRATIWLAAPWIILGMVLLAARGGPARRWAGVVLILTAAGMIVTGLFYGYVRHGTVLLPLWYSAAGAAGVWLVRLLRRRGAPEAAAERPLRLRRLRPAMVLAGLLLLLEAWGATQDRNYIAKGTTLRGQQQLNPHETMYLWPEGSRGDGP
ncbi:MAG: hypothetical protein GF355_16400 [Candidatus Eisenbacteria bacterium]|nr:hypothetical protein [Candidatus Eisenbacteria bacterium]